MHGPRGSPLVSSAMLVSFEVHWAFFFKKKTLCYNPSSWQAGWRVRLGKESTFAQSSTITDTTTNWMTESDIFADRREKEVLISQG